TKSIPTDQMESAISRNCERVNRPLEQLYYPNLNATLEQESDRGESLSDTIDRICNEANSILTDSVPDGFPEIK
ncbi:MAG: hypothetical protein ACKO15_05690, partial [Burkholderiales bacterium]